jgi:phosphoribosylaminoimidazole carboxylase PurE protein
MEHKGVALVGIVMGSDSDLPVMEEAVAVMKEFGVAYDLRILSAHRSPQEAAAYAQEALPRGLRVLIAGAGWAAHLAGALAAGTTLPVIGVPIDSSPLLGLDALLSTVQMPPGVPVATMGIGRGGARNAGLLAVQILALNDPLLAAKLAAHKQRLVQGVLAKDRAVQGAS